MSDTQKLLPCPFCGGEAEIERRGNRRVSTIYSCTECGCMLETGEEWGHGERWNRRATPPEDKTLREALKDILLCPAILDELNGDSETNNAVAKARAALSRATKGGDDDEG